MSKISIELETVTATFLHVEPKEEARWRAAPFRGMARWWFRAVVGASFPTKDVSRLEAELFGSTSGIEIKPSKIVFRILDPSPSSRSTRAEVNPGGSRGGECGALPAKCSATLELKSASHAGNPEDVLRKAYACIWTAIHFGGIGQRGRRGAGSMRIKNVGGISGLPNPATARDPRKHACELAKGLYQVRKILQADVLRPFLRDAEFPIMHPQCCNVVVATAITDSESELAARKLVMRLRRSRHRTTDHKREYEFGDIGSRGGSERLSSPLWVRIADIWESDALLVFTLMKHTAANRLGADWDNAYAMMNMPELRDGCSVDLYGGNNDRLAI
jgi:CRISPR type III-B/RAMP module RAMP protein Cmr1